MAERPNTCGACGKRLNRKHWYYRHAGFFCSKACWHKAEEKAGAEEAEKAEKAKAEQAEKAKAADQPKPEETNAEPPKEAAAKSAG